MIQVSNHIKNHNHAVEQLLLKIIFDESFFYTFLKKDLIINIIFRVVLLRFEKLSLKT